MEKISFRTFLENSDIFGFNKETPEKISKVIDDKPIKSFSLELLIDLLSKKRIGVFQGESKFINEIQWGSNPGAVKLEIDTGFTFYIKKLNVDKEGNPRWLTKKMFQLDRNGRRDQEDSVAQQVFEWLSKIFETPLDSPDKPCKLWDIAVTVYDNMKSVTPRMFIPTGIKKINENAYLLTFEVSGHGVAAPDQRRVEQNQTAVLYDPDQGAIRIFNYNIESPLKRRSWEIMENDVDLYFFPSQSAEEIADCLAVHMKFY